MQGGAISTIVCCLLTAIILDAPSERRGETPSSPTASFIHAMAMATITMVFLSLVNIAVNVKDLLWRTVRTAKESGQITIFFCV
jgi:hypothetical protein